MQKKSIFRLGLIAAGLGLSFMILRASQPSSKPTGFCKKSQKVCPRQQKEVPSELFVEALGRQFFTTVLFTY